ncbi:MAG: Fic/DOC family N-terminal domain-containing protein, partial [Rhodanobacteraceae bacterium]
MQTAQGYAAFVPAPLPPHLDYDTDLVRALSRADAALSELSGLGRVLPNPHLLIAPYLRREAVLSSRIEGTQASLADL